tara:strand:+ start:3423 stop:3938 length:516 start_codon:yes stop_codon:yes gene_type:complete
MAASTIVKNIAKTLGKTMASGPTAPFKAHNLIGQVAPDAAFAGVTQFLMPEGTTPTERLIAFATQAGGGSLGGLGASALLPTKGGLKWNPGARMTTELAGGFAGDMAGQFAGDKLMAFLSPDKMNPWQRAAAAGNEEQLRAVEQKLLALHGLGGYNPLQVMDPTLAANGLS